LGNGDGTFQTHVDYLVGILPYSIAAGDFNGDGQIDLAVANHCGNSLHCEDVGSVSVLLGNGDGTFQTQMQYATGEGPEAVAIGDFNGDGNLDLAVANNAGGTGNTVGIFLGNGDGTFQPQVEYQTGLSPLGLVAADFTNDGQSGLAVANNLSNSVSVLLSAVTNGLRNASLKGLAVAALAPQSSVRRRQ